VAFNGEPMKDGLAETVALVEESRVFTQERCCILAPVRDRVAEPLKAQVRLGP
jgi:hypothetical protein